MKLTSSELQIIQIALEDKIKHEIEKPDTDFKGLSKLVLFTGKIDRLRRKAWNKEHFEPYEKLADEIFNLAEAEKPRTFVEDGLSSDDTPF